MTKPTAKVSPLQLKTKSINNLEKTSTKIILGAFIKTILPKLYNLKIN